MKDFRRQNGQGGGFNNHQNNKYHGDRDNRGLRDGAMMHKAVCSECGKQCEVPFAPNGNKPVYCNECFGKKKGYSDNRSENRFEKRDFASRGPIGHESRLNAEPRDGGVRELKSHMDSLNSKLDRVIKILENFSSSMAVPKPVEKFVQSQGVAVAKNNKPMNVEKAFKSFPVTKIEKPKSEKAKVVVKKAVSKVVAKVTVKAKPVTKKKK